MNMVQFLWFMNVKFCMKRWFCTGTGECISTRWIWVKIWLFKWIWGYLGPDKKSRLFCSIGCISWSLRYSVQAYPWELFLKASWSNFYFFMLLYILFASKVKIGRSEQCLCHHAKQNFVHHCRSPMWSKDAIHLAEGGVKPVWSRHCIGSK